MSLRVVAVLALVLLLPAGAAWYPVTSQQASLRLRVDEGQARLEAARIGGVPPGLGTARDDFQPLQEAVRLNSRNFRLLHVLHRLNLIAAIAALATILGMTLVSATRRRTGREFRDGSPILGAVSVLASMSFLLQGVSLIAFLVGFELWIFGGITWMFASAWGIAAMWSVVQARFVFHLPESLAWWSPSGLFLIWRATLTDASSDTPLDVELTSTSINQAAIDEFVTAVFRPEAPIVRRLVIAAAVPLLLMAAALWLQQMASTNLVAWQPPILEPWLPGASLPPREWVGESLTGERLYEPHLVRTRTQACMMLAATIYSLGVLIFGVVAAYRNAKAVGSRPWRMLLSRAVRYALQFSPILMLLSALAVVALVWCVEVLVFGAMLWVTPACAVAMGVGILAFCLSHFSPYDIEPEARSVAGILLPQSASPALHGLISDTASSLGMKPPEHVAVVLDPGLAVVAPPLSVAATSVLQPTVVISLPFCRVLSISELKALMSGRMIEFSDAAPAYATSLADRIVQTVTLNVFTAPAGVLAAPVILLARLVAAPVGINPDPSESLLGHARFKEMAASMIWPQVLSEDRGELAGNGHAIEHTESQTPGAAFAAMFAGAGFDLEGSDRTSAASLIPDIDQLELALARMSAQSPGDPP